jgi:hypothetical protein
MDSDAGTGTHDEMKDFFLSCLFADVLVSSRCHPSFSPTLLVSDMADQPEITRFLRLSFVVVSSM